MIGVYFSGTGNSRYAVELFCKEYDQEAEVFSIEDANVTEAVKGADMLVFAYPVQYSTVPKILRDFICDNSGLWKNKKIFIIATMGLFSGDGAGVLGRLLQSCGAEILGGLHLKMPDSIGDEKVLKRSLQKNKALVKAAEQKVRKAAIRLKSGKPTQEGIGVWYRLAGFFGQRLYFGHKTKHYSDRLCIDENKCVGCGKCEKLCPMNNIKIVDKKVVQNNRCTMCYRCINHCPGQAMTLLGKAVVEQRVIEKYLDIRKGEELPGYKAKSFSIPYNGGEIWIEHLDGIYGYEELVLSKLKRDIKLFTRPSATSYICFVFDETTVTERITEAVIDSILEQGKHFVKIAFVGLDRKNKQTLKKKLQDESFSINFLEGLEDAKQWLLK